MNTNQLEISSYDIESVHASPDTVRIVKSSYQPPLTSQEWVNIINKLQPGEGLEVTRAQMQKIRKIAMQNGQKIITHGAETKDKIQVFLSNMFAGRVGMKRSVGRPRKNLLTLSVH